MCCQKPLGNCTKWSLFSENFSPNVIFLWFRGYLGDLLWIRVIIMMIICHCTVTAQVPVNRRFRMIECRINHITSSWSSVLLSQSRSREWIWYHFHLQACVTWKARWDIYGFVATIKTFGRVLNLFWSLSLSLFVSYFQLFIFNLASRCLNERHNLNLNCACYQIWLEQ